MTCASSVSLKLAICVELANRNMESVIEQVNPDIIITSSRSDEDAIDILRDTGESVFYMISHR